MSRDYWLEKGKDYQKEFNYTNDFREQEYTLINYLMKHVKFSTVLEVGCGFGRITKLLLSTFPNITEYVATDLSSDQIKNAKKYVKNKKVKYITTDIQSLALDKKYDLVLASEVLMHIPSTEIRRVILNLVSHSNKHIINIDWYEEGKEIVGAFNSVHPYYELYFNAGVSVVNETSVEGVRQSIFHATL